ncbi:insulin-like growth factor 2 mRNA-binding protein 3-B isoform X2 [Lingula anatina]|uniref:Insulin-like growth factor 2 mRNA-binding protein 3-B isoform X2 n=1 Tax=Lingula anatina TaxID=7574 RepID=A0A1S3J5Q6_LINAN|nr:insulin-like growth factor 2 mRNA-binding protein 3-B isoform X2 [Lingula anatina]|eukprot:XP_013405581.1 insulin-like growth factor 2 mRNA-binding protein 3-B isoform X2 [Lingula anatina]
MMHKLYVGNLSREVSERTLRTLFEDQGLGVTDILVKNKPQSCYAFVDCPDQTTVDKAIDSLNGYNLLGSVLQVEPSMSIHRRTAKIIIRHVPSQVTHEDLLRLVSAFGPVIKTDESTNRNGENVVVVIYESPEAAQEAASQLNGYELLGTQISVELAAPRNNRRFGGRRNFSGMGSNRNSDFPLRILVPRETVGAIIGRGGQTIKKITQDTRAR